jgi:hypothetical protein
VTRCPLRLAGRLTRALLGGIVITAAFAFAPPLVRAFDPGLVPLKLVAADWHDTSSGSCSILWQSVTAWMPISCADVIRTFKTNRVFYTGIPQRIDAERLDELVEHDMVRDWKIELSDPWNEERGTTILSGWPFRAVAGTHIARLNNATNSTEHMVSRGFLISNRVDGEQVVPYGPLAIGMSLDILCWSLVLTVVGGVASSVRRQWRRRTARCENCGHRQAPGTTECPECGTPRV